MFVIANVLQPLIDVNDAIVKFWHDSVGLGWGLSIIGLTVVVRLLILPLTFKQVRSMQGLQKLQPEMKKIQERYKEDKKRQQEEMMKLYQEHQINPLGSCLPLVLQLPFFFALYQTLRSGGEISKQIKGPPAGDNGFLFIPDLTKVPHSGVLVGLLLMYLVTQLAASGRRRGAARRLRGHRRPRARTARARGAAEATAVRASRRRPRRARRRSA